MNWSPDVRGVRRVQTMTFGRPGRMPESDLQGTARRPRQLLPYCPSAVAPAGLPGVAGAPTKARGAPGPWIGPAAASGFPAQRIVSQTWRRGSAEQQRREPKAGRFASQSKSGSRRRHTRAGRSWRGGSDPRRVKADRPADASGSLRDGAKRIAPPAWWPGSARRIGDAPQPVKVSGAGWLDKRAVGPRRPRASGKAPPPAAGLCMGRIFKPGAVG